MPQTEPFHGYDVIIQREEENGVTEYLARIPELPGCHASGSTPMEALAELEDVAEGWLSVMKEAGEPVPPPAAYSGRLTLRMPKWLHRQLAEAAELEQVPLNQYIVSLLALATGRWGSGQGRTSDDGPVGGPATSALVPDPGVLSSSGDATVLTWARLSSAPTRFRRSRALKAPAIPSGESAR
ncbi:MAG: toxin-antitoxin system HicB family antitoxin [Bacillota bacterium]|nr:toxin-antitoxin system HicB family antitoxin [Bacillota bacterium]